MSILIQLGIIAAILAFVLTLLIAIANFLPFSEFEAAITAAGPYLANAQQVFSVDQLLLVLTAFTVLEGALLVYITIRWVYQKMAGMN